MRYFLSFVFILLPGMFLLGQGRGEIREGQVSYVSSRNVYVKFASTGGIEPGDTLFVLSGGQPVPALVVRELSSISCVGEPVGDHRFTAGDRLVTAIKEKKAVTPAIPEPVPVPEKAAAPASTVTRPASSPRSVEPALSGYLSAASTFYLSGKSEASQRLRYTLSMNLTNIGGSRLSAETYLVFAHRPGRWEPIGSNLFNGLKVYSLALKYDIHPRHRFWLGRRVNPRIANAGAVDGLQYEFKTGSFTLGLVAGLRPRMADYGFDSRLLQAGGYLGHDFAGRYGSMQTTLAFLNQANDGRTDRRFAYLQHSNSLVKNLFFFGSAEAEVYRVKADLTDTAAGGDTVYRKTASPSLSNLYLSLRYRPLRQLSVSVSYSERKNIIYYSIYRNLVEQLLESATVRGFVLQLTGQPAKPLTLGVQAGYRNEKGDLRPTKNFYGYATYRSLPGIGADFTLSATLVETVYLSGGIYSAGLFKDFATGKVSAGLNYRYIRYKFPQTGFNQVQHMGEISLNWRMARKFYLGLNGEATFDSRSTGSRIYVNLTHRF